MDNVKLVTVGVKVTIEFVVVLRLVVAEELNGVEIKVEVEISLVVVVAFKNKKQIIQNIWNIFK